MRPSTMAHMSRKQTQERARRLARSAVPAVSAVLKSGMIVEMISETERKRTGFAVWRGNDWVWASEIEDDSGLMLEPYAFDNELLRNDVVLFASKPKDYRSQEQLLAEIRSFIHQYVGLDEGFERLASAYVLFTWVFDAFNELPYLRVTGDYGSGKTRFLQTVGSICYRPIFASGASTVSPVFHMLDLFGGTLIVDEADLRSSDEKADMVKIFNNGNVRGMPVLRSQLTRARAFEPRVFRVFGPKIVATRGRYDDRGLESRFLTGEMRADFLRNDIAINLPASFKEEALDLRNKLLMYRFQTLHRHAPEETLADRALEPRLNQVLVPLLSVIDDTQEREALKRAARASHHALTSKQGRPDPEEYRWEQCV